MVENDKEMDANESVNSGANTTHAQSIHPYNWMLDGESVLSEMPVKYVLYIMSRETTIRGGLGGKSANYTKTDINKIIATDRRIVFINKRGELFNDKYRATPHSGRMPRQFFFYGKNTFDEYLGHMADHNKKIISDLSSKDPTFEKSFNEKGTVGDKGKLEAEGYINGVYFAYELSLITQKAYLKGSFLKRKVYQVLGPINGQPPAWFLKAKKKGIQIKAMELRVRNIEVSKAYADRGKNMMAHITDKKRYQLQPTDFFIRIDKNQIDDLLKLVDSISGKIAEMSDYTDKNVAKDLVFENYLKSDKPEE